MRTKGSLNRSFLTQVTLGATLCVLTLFSSCACWVPLLGKTGEFRQATVDSLQVLHDFVPAAFASLPNVPSDTRNLEGLIARTSAQLDTENGRDCNGGVKGDLSEGLGFLQSTRTLVQGTGMSATAAQEGAVRAAKFFQRGIDTESRKNGK